MTLWELVLRCAFSAAGAALAVTAMVKLLAVWDWGIAGTVFSLFIGLCLFVLALSGLGDAKGTLEP